MNPFKDFLPPILVRKLSGVFYGWSGNYTSWEKARQKSQGYDSAVIFHKVKSSLLKIKKGEAVYERDSVIFDKVYYSFPLLSALSLIALNNRNKLNVLDFGGSLGSSYFQNKSFFKNLEQFNWCIVEQPHFVKEGQATFADDHLQFYYDITGCFEKHKIDVLLLSSVLQYLEKPYAFLDEIFLKNIEYIMIDRAPLLKNDNDRITIQTVPRNIYKAKYPCWILNENKLLNYILRCYDLIFDTETAETINISKASFKSFLFKRKK